MLLFKKKYFYHLYIFFLALVLFFSEFSTNIVSSKNYNILDIKVEEKYDINFDKSKVINKAFEEAFEVLIYKLIQSKDRSKISNISLMDKKNLIENFEEHIDPNDPTNNCLDVAIITAPEKRTKKTIEKLNTVAGRVLNK